MPELAQNLCPADREAATREAIRLVWRNLPESPSTFSECDCGRGNGRGGGPCLKCAEETLSAMSGKPELAARYVATANDVRQLEREMVHAAVSREGVGKGDGA